ncbi:tRNA (N(6)-L-threonylcarbamoyladenosine(37)-C(2))-methylthiotransferase MtaB, partial [Sulfurovum sp. bin170]|nr:tRNA (N(6)-L-threonylcarbamoyladenosine(37)-C(2))-methylthiotransferase MtaB [Sulfurovum sp. bin170]
ASTTMGDEVRGDIAKARHRELTSLIKDKNLLFRKNHNRNLDILLENGKNGVYQGYDQYFNRAEVRSSDDLSGNWVSFENAIVQGSKNVAIFQ